MSGAAGHSDGSHSESAVICCFDVLALPELPTEVLAAGAALDPSRAGGELEALARRGVLRSTRSKTYRLDVAPGGHPAELGAVVLTRIGEKLLWDALNARVPARTTDETGYRLTTFSPASALPDADAPAGPEWIEHRDRLVIAVLRACVEHGLHHLAVALCTGVWHLVPDDAPSGWCRELTDLGTEAAVAGRRPRSFARLLDLGARWFADGHDYLTAEAFGVRELAVWEELADTDHVVDVLRRRADIYQRWGRFNRALDCCRDWLSTEQERGDSSGQAAALTRFGLVLLAADRPEAATGYLTRAVDTYRGLPHPPPKPQARASVALGRALWSTGAPAAARRSFSSALALLVDVDSAAAQQVRDLLRNPEDQPLPADPG